MLKDVDVQGFKKICFLWITEDKGNDIDDLEMGKRTKIKTQSASMDKSKYHIKKSVK